MKNISLIAALLFAVPALAVADPHAKLSDTDISVVSDLHHANQAEVDMGNYALAHGTKTVKAYATMIVKDHSANDAKLVAMAKRHGVAKIPAPPADSAEMDDMMKLKRMKGEDFDRAYIDMMIEDHVKDIKKVTGAIDTVADADLKDHLTNTKPALEQHLDSAKTLKTASPQASK